MSERVNGQVVGDIAIVTLADNSAIEVVLPPYEDFPDNTPQVIAIRGMPGRVFQKTSGITYGPPVPTTYLEILPPEAAPIS